jgi:hypothetical protein
VSLLGLGLIRPCTPAAERASECVVAAVECTATCADGTPAGCGPGLAAGGAAATCVLALGAGAAEKADLAAAGRPGGNPRLNAATVVQCAGGGAPTCADGSRPACLCHQ